MRTARLLVAVILLGLLSSWFLALSASAAEACIPAGEQDPRFQLPGANCPPKTSTATPTSRPTPLPTAEASSEPSVGMSSAPQATTNSEEWAGDAADSASELSKVAADRYGRDPGSRDGFVATFALTFAMGLMIFAVMLILLIARASRAGVSTDARRELMESIPRVLLYVPVMFAVPGLVHIVSSWSHDMGEAFAQQSGVSFGRFLTQAGEGFMDVNLLSLLGKAFLALVLLIAYVFSLLVWLLEDLVAEYALWLLAALIPIAAAMSLWPTNRRMWWRIVGVVVGCALVPTVTRFAFWAMFQMQGDVLASGITIMALLQGIVVVVLATSMPVVLGFVMPAVMPNGASASDGAAGNWQGHASSAGQQSKSGLQRLGEQFKEGKGTRDTDGAGLPARVETGATQAGKTGAASTSASSTSGATAGAGAKAGASAGTQAGAAGAASKIHPAVAVAAVAAGVAISAGNAVKGASRESALRMNTASGGGYATDPDPSSPPRGGQPPARRDSGSGPEAQPMLDGPVADADEPGGGGEAAYQVEPLSDRPALPPPGPEPAVYPVSDEPVRGPRFRPPAPPSGVVQVKQRPVRTPAPPQARTREPGPPPMPTRRGRG